MRLTGRLETVAVEPEHIRALELKYPGIAVQDELCKMVFWLDSHTEARRPVKVWRFVTTWLQRARPPIAPVLALKAARRDNMAGLCGRTGNAGYIDGEVIRETVGHLRLADERNVG